MEDKPEPYTITRLALRWRPRHELLGWYIIYYPTFSWGESSTMVQAKDELDAFTLGLEKMKTLKRKAERMRDKAKEQTK